MTARLEKLTCVLLPLMLFRITACGGASSTPFSNSFSTSLHLDGATGIDAEIPGLLAWARLETSLPQLGDGPPAAEAGLALSRLDGTGGRVALRGIGPGPGSALVLRLVSLDELGTGESARVRADLTVLGWR